MRNAFVDHRDRSAAAPSVPGPGAVMQAAAGMVCWTCGKGGHRARDCRTATKSALPKHQRQPRRLRGPKLKPASGEAKLCSNYRATIQSDADCKVQQKAAEVQRRVAANGGGTHLGAVVPSTEGAVAAPPTFGPSAVADPPATMSADGFSFRAVAAALSASVAPTSAARPAATSPPASSSAPPAVFAVGVSGTAASGPFVDTPRILEQASAAA